MALAAAEKVFFDRHAYLDWATTWCLILSPGYFALLAFWADVQDNS
ncbi:MAG: hypothetical protein NUV77_15810 [Thermoguttaceae bacterium]|nr:hypothetical protein [Thermoguttaceae bacterium]